MIYKGIKINKLEKPIIGSDKVEKKYYYSVITSAGFGLRYLTESIETAKEEINKTIEFKNRKKV